jgi:hypothetical protein
MSGIYAGSALAGYGASMAGEPWQLGWSLTFEVFGFVGVAYGLIVFFLLRNPKAEEAPVVEETVVAAAPAAPEVSMGQVFKSIFTGSGMYVLLVMIALAGFANWFVLNWYPRLLQDFLATFHTAGQYLDITDEDAAEHSTLWLSIAKYVSVLGCAVLADFWYQRNKNARAYVPGIAFCVAGPCVLLAMMFGVEIGLYAVLALVTMQGVAQGAIDATLMPVLRNTIDERYAATGYGLLNFTSAGVGASVTWVAGLLKDHGVELTTILAMGGVLMVVVGILLFCLPKKKNA